MAAPADPLHPGAKPDHIREMTEGVSLLNGDPKTAIRKLSTPMIAAMLFMSPSGWQALVPMPLPRSGS